MRSAPEQDKGIDPAATRKSILDSATRLFAEKGFAGTSMNDIATRAGVTKSLILYHYATKDDLWREVLRHKTAPFFEVTQALVEGDDVQLSALMRRKFEANQRDPELARMMAWMSLEPRLASPELQERARKLRDRILRDSHDLGIPDGVDPEMFLALVMSAIDGWFRFRHLYGAVLGSQMVDEESEAAFLQVLMSVFFSREGDSGS